MTLQDTPGTDTAVSREAQACFERTLTYNSDHRGARRELGYRWIGHRWVGAAGGAG